MAILVIGDDKTKAIPVLGSGGSTPVVSPLDITPSTSAQQFIPSGGTDGYNPVNVAAVTSSIDNHIKAGNIVNGVTILGVTGTAPKMISGIRGINQNGIYSVVNNTTNTFISQISVNVIPSGGTINIENNGIYNVANYATANVNVAGGGNPSYTVNTSDLYGYFPSSIESDWERFLQDEAAYVKLNVVGMDPHGQQLIYPVFYNSYDDIILLNNYFYNNQALFANDSYIDSYGAFGLHFYSAYDGMDYALQGNIPQS